MNHESMFIHDLKDAPGVSVRLRKMTFGRRIELLRRIGGLTKKASFLEAGRSEGEQLEGEADRQTADRILLEWAIESVSGLTIDGKIATPELLLEAGPEEIVQEVLRVIRGEIGLTEEERKN